MFCQLENCQLINLVMQKKYDKLKASLPDTCKVEGFPSLYSGHYWQTCPDLPAECNHPAVHPTHHMWLSELAPME